MKQALIVVDMQVGDTVMIRGKAQRLWPVHCVEKSKGANFTPGFSQDQFEAVFHKGTDPLIDSYSAFYDNVHEKSTGLSAYLRGRHITHVVLIGIALEYCVLYSALDALAEGFSVAVIPNLCRAIDASKVSRTLDTLRRHGVEIRSTGLFCFPVFSSGAGRGWGVSIASSNAVRSSTSSNILLRRSCSADPYTQV